MLAAANENGTTPAPWPWAAASTPLAPRRGSFVHWPAPSEFTARMRAEYALPSSRPVASAAYAGSAPSATVSTASRTPVPVRAGTAMSGGTLPSCDANSTVQTAP